MARILLSYAREDEMQVRGVYRRLLDAGFDVWMDKINLLPGQRWEQEIPRAIRNSDFILIFFSKHSVAKRGYIQREFCLALKTLEEMPPDAIHTIPIRLDDCQIPEQFRPLQWSDLFEEGEFDRIVRALRLGMEQRQKGAPEPALEPSPRPRPDSNRPFSGDEGPSGADASVYPPHEPEPAIVFPPQKPLVPDQQSRQVKVVPAVDETQEFRATTPIQSPPKPASAENDKPFDPVSRPEDAATTPVSEEDQPKVRRYTTRDIRVITGLFRSQKRRLVLVGGVLLCGLITMLYLVFSEPTPRLHLTNSIGMQFVLIPAGEFQMGSTSGYDERPVHTVRISKLFYLGIHEVTQGQWEAVMGNNPSMFKGDATRPVEMVSWEDVQTFIKKLNAREGGTKYRLPTEAEWEYAARAGSTTAYSFGDDSSQLGRYAWFEGNAGKTTHPVGKLQPNAWSLYDMHGNLWEWVQDWYGKYAVEPVTDPQGPASGSYRVLRGGSWFNGGRCCQSADRYNDAPRARSSDIGFRLLRMAP